MKFFLKILLLCMMVSTVAAGDLSMELQNISLPYAIRTLAKLLNMNVMISPSVHGVTVLNLNHVAPFDAMNMLLASHGLAKTRSGDIWLIAPFDELTKLKQQELKWQEMDESASQLVNEVWQIKYAKAEDIARILRDEQASFFTKRGHVRVDARTNTICIQDVAKRLKSINILLHKLDVPVQQVAIAARLVSVDSDYERELGVQFSVKSLVEELSKNKKNNMSQQKGQYSVAIATLADGSLLDVKLIALENAGHAELISSPSLFAANQ